MAAMFFNSNDVRVALAVLTATILLTSLAYGFFGANFLVLLSPILGIPTKVVLYFVTNASALCIKHTDVFF